MLTYYLTHTRSIMDWTMAYGPKPAARKFSTIFHLPAGTTVTVEDKQGRERKYKVLSDGGPVKALGTNR